MNDNAFGAEFGALTDDEQVTVVGGDTYLYYQIGYGIGYAAGTVVNAWKWITS